MGTLPSYRFVLALLLVAFACNGQQQSEQQKLKAVQQEIKRKQADIARQQQSVDSLQRQLQQDELAIANTAKKLVATTQSLTNNKQQQQTLQQRQRELNRDQQQQQTLLAEQIRSAYMAGKHDYLKLLFSQEQAGKFERINSYYQYLNQARVTEIKRFTQLLQTLTEVEQQLQRKQSELVQLQQTQQLQSEQLKQQQLSRQSTLQALSSRLESDAAKIAALQVNEQALLEAIANAQRRAQREKHIVNNLKGLAKLKGKLLKPANGKTRQLFGKRRQGQVRWKGILIEGSVGSSVNAVHQGTVLYADWLKGFGLLTAVDHGQGYMSVYGHNQALLKQVGDTVEAGEAIALVGQSGGQSSPGLYFEIRHKGKAVNPKGWFNRR